MDFKFKTLFKNKNIEKRSIRNISYSAAISAKARIKLHKFFINVKNDGGRLLYCDTDSIFAAYPSYDKRLYIKTEKWMQFYSDAVFASPKSYALKTEKEEIIKIKGISFKNLNFEEFKYNFYNNKEISFNFQKIDVKKNFTLNQKLITKNINFERYDKRMFSHDKKYTTPFNISNL